MRQRPTNIATRSQCARGRRLVVMPLLLASLGACAAREVDSAAPDAAVSEPDLTGTVELTYIDGLDGSSALEYSVEVDDTQRVQLVFDVEPELAPGTEIEVWGDWEGDSRLVVRDFQVTSSPKRLDEPWSRTPMLHRVAVLSADAVSVTASDIAAEMAEVSRFFAETTHGIDTFSLKVYRNYSLGLSATDCDNRGGVMNRLTEAFSQEGFAPTDYEHLVFIVPASCGSWRGATGYVGAVGDNGSYGVRVRSIFKDDVAYAYPFIHELGHNLGMRHAQAAKCTDGLYAPSLAGCSIEDYGDANDPMGGGWTELYWNTPHQRFLGWIAPERVITAGGNGTFNLIPVDAKQGCGIQALRIPIPNEPAKYFYVEYRKARSDSAYAGTGTGVRGDAVLITRSQDGSTSSSSTQRIELGTGRFEGAALARRYDLGSGVSVEVRSMGGEAAEVVVQAPGGNPHRDDTGGVVAKLSDGSVGPASCAEGPPSVDGCPGDPNKTAPGICGCGTADLDGDGDGTADCHDGCAADATKVAPGVCGCGVSEGTCAPMTISLRAEDAFIDALRRSQNFGRATSLRVDSAPAVRRSLIKPIGLGRIPRGARVQSATLTMRVVNGGQPMSARKLTTAWSQSTVTFSTAPRAAAAFASVSGSTGTKVIDVTAIVQAWVNGEAAHGIGLYPTGADDVVINSAEHPVVQTRPTFRITYRAN